MRKGLSNEEAVFGRGHSAENKIYPVPSKKVRSPQGRKVSERDPSPAPEPFPYPVRRDPDSKPPGPELPAPAIDPQPAPESQPLLPPSHQSES